MKLMVAAMAYFRKTHCLLIIDRDKASYEVGPPPRKPLSLPGVLCDLAALREIGFPRSRFHELRAPVEMPAIGHAVFVPPPVPSQLLRGFAELHLHFLTAAPTVDSQFEHVAATLFG